MNIIVKNGVGEIIKGTFPHQDHTIMVASNFPDVTFSLLPSKDEKEVGVLVTTVNKNKLYSAYYLKEVGVDLTPTKDIAKSLYKDIKRIIK